MLGKNDFSFFATIDMLVREAMKKFEERLLPTFQQATKDTGVPVEDVPAEGYYSESKKLRDVLKHFRALQNNPSNTVTDAVKKLHLIYNENAIFGLGPAKPTALNSQYLDEGQELKHAVIAPMWDTLGIAVQRVTNKESALGWNIQRIMEETEDIDLGTHLVGLAVLVDRTYKNKTKNGKYNPVASTMGAETTVGSRYVPQSLGAEPRPRITPEVKEMGMQVINAYNKLFASVSEGKGLKLPTSVEDILEKTYELDVTKIVGRCVRIAEDLVSQQVYHWAIIMDRDFKKSVYPIGLRAVEFINPNIVTTEEFRSNPKKYTK